jgi:hypothetical protein
MGVSDDGLRATGARRRERQAREGLAGALRHGWLLPEKLIEATQYARSRRMRPRCC